ncbi:MAG TPA: hypothetical protein VLJ68_11325 [Chitinophagaceae bacterium]|nr:hypothetical protein [Chitinophagaceae bacterium]
MKIKNIDGLSAQELQVAVTHGARFVHYPFILSLIIVTFKRTSGVYLVRENENAAIKGFPFTLLSALFGWWGIPFGPKHTFESIRTNLRGGKDVTEEVMSVVAGYVQFEETKKRK